MIINKYKKQYYILGKGSNILLLRHYYNRVLIKLNVKESKSPFIVNASDSVAYLNNKFIKDGIETLNFLTSVPCSMGGAIYMNAGAFSKSIKDVIEYVYIFSLDDYKFKVLNNEECNFLYRDSYFRHNNVLILGAKIKLIYDDSNKINKEYKKYLKLARKVSKVPLSVSDIDLKTILEID